jgi:alkylation response protein AidB-like acyl-CoA dehydrogenase
MDFEVRYSEEQESFRRKVKVWLDEHVHVDLINRTDPRFEPLDVYLKQRELGRLLGEKGWLFPTSPTAYGGGGLDVDSALVLMEEMKKLGLGLPPYYDSGGVLGSVAILVWGTEEQKRKFLPPIYRGDLRTWQLLTEPNAGSDLAAVQATAVRDGDEYVINGEKIYIGSEHGADALWTLARTSIDAPRHENLGWFMIDGNAPGITIQPMHLVGGIDKNTVYLENVRVPADALVGGENNGWKVAATHLELEHGFRSDSVLGQRGQLQMERMIEYCRNVSPNGQRIIDDSYRRDLLCQAFIRHEILRLWGLRNFWLSRSEETQTYEGAQTYYFQKVTGMWFDHVIAEIVGPSGLVWSTEHGAAEGSLGRAQASSIGGSHGGGTIDIQRVVMARRMGIGRAEAEAGATLA